MTPVSLTLTPPPTPYIWISIYDSPLHLTLGLASPEAGLDGMGSPAESRSALDGIGADRAYGAPTTPPELGAIMRHMDEVAITRALVSVLAPALCRLTLPLTPLPITMHPIHSIHAQVVAISARLIRINPSLRPSPDSACWGSLTGTAVPTMAALGVPRVTGGAAEAVGGSEGGNDDDDDDDDGGEESIHAARHEDDDDDDEEEEEEEEEEEGEGVSETDGSVQDQDQGHVGGSPLQEDSTRDNHDTTRDNHDTTAAAGNDNIYDNVDDVDDDDMPLWSPKDARERVEAVCVTLTRVTSPGPDTGSSKTAGGGSCASSGSPEPSLVTVETAACEVVAARQCDYDPATAAMVHKSDEAPEQMTAAVVVAAAAADTKRSSDNIRRALRLCTKRKHAQALREEQWLQEQAVARAKAKEEVEVEARQVATTAKIAAEAEAVAAAVSADLADARARAPTQATAGANATANATTVSPSRHKLPHKNLKSFLASLPSPVSDSDSDSNDDDDDDEGPSTVLDLVRLGNSPSRMRDPAISGLTFDDEAASTTPVVRGTDPNRSPRRRSEAAAVARTSPTPTPSYSGHDLTALSTMLDSGGSALSSKSGVCVGGNSAPVLRLPDGSCSISARVSLGASSPPSDTGAPDMWKGLGDIY